ncbi:hypothetical protein GCM10009663_16850 [Kitasatospora arboriphila]|uniref:Cupin domain-containing protein n=1 Tax=Kitasatospora arboriphila TaxID=258052 RepID=A0ABP4DWL5_9ACTN
MLTMSVDMRKWNSFATAESPGFTRTVFLSGVVQDPEHVRGLIADALRTATREAPGDLRIRAFRPGAFDYRLTKRFTASPLGPDETAGDWLARVADGPDACIAVNDISAWSLPLGEWAEGLVRELLGHGARELPSGADVYTFVADSGWTPFGIHKDTEASLILHLGPAPKEVWVWPDGSFDDSAVTPSPSFGRICFDIEEHLATAERHLLQPGDFLCIPQDTYHVFRNLGPSAFVGLTPYPARPRPLAADAFLRAALPAAGEPPAPTGRAITGLVRTAAEQPDFAERVAHEIDLAQLKRRTNGYLSTPHRAALPAAAPDPDATLRWARPGAVAAAGTADGTVLVVRGRTLHFADRLDFGPLEQATGSPLPFTPAELADLLPAGLTGPQRTELAAELHRRGAVVTA